VPSEIICEACGWVATVVSGYPPDVWAEHVAGCPAVGGAVRYFPPEPYVPPAPPRQCAHRPVKRHIATLPGGRKRYAVVCALCGRHLVA
jgi:hypothetical protein